jgi:hypothetical protein
VQFLFKYTATVGRIGTLIHEWLSFPGQDLSSKVACFIQFCLFLLSNLCHTGAVTERIQRAHRQKNSPMMLLFPGWCIIILPSLIFCIWTITDHFLVYSSFMAHISLYPGIFFLVLRYTFSSQYATCVILIVYLCWDCNHILMSGSCNYIWFVSFRLFLHGECIGFMFVYGYAPSRKKHFNISCYICSSIVQPVLVHVYWYSKPKLWHCVLWSSTYSVNLSLPFYCSFFAYTPNTLDYIPIVEGTTTNGDYLLPFKTGAFLARAPVQPVILRYPYKRFSPAWDSMSGVSANGNSVHTYSCQIQMPIMNTFMIRTTKYLFLELMLALLK